MTRRDQLVGGVICLVCVVVAIAYAAALFWPPLAVYRLWIIAVPGLIAFIVILRIGAWIGMIMATTPPPQPIDTLQPDDTPETTVTTE